MKLTDSVRNTIIKASAIIKVSRKKLSISYVSLFLAFLVLISGTISWFTFKDSAKVDSDTFSLEAASGLRVNEGEDLANHIKLDNIKLDEVSSVDGRNMFLPTTGTFTDSTASMVFREGSVGDKNEKYLYRDFTLKGDSGITYVYVKSYKITVGSKSDPDGVYEVFNGSTGIQYDSTGKPVSQTQHEECPVRIAFIKDSSEAPQVIDPTAIVDNYVQKYSAVNSTDENGKASTLESTGVSFSDYYFVTGSPMFTLFGNTPINVTMVVWLEGTENVKTGTSNSSRYAGRDISIDIELESNWDDMDTITFVDKTIEDKVTDPANATEANWINKSDKAIILMGYTDTDGVTRTVVMKESADHKSWIAPLPKNVTTNISFYRYDINEETIFNAWHTKPGVNKELNPIIAKDGAKYSSWIGYYGDLQVDRGASVVYTAVRGNGWGEVKLGESPGDGMSAPATEAEVTQRRLAPCLGYWDYKKPGTTESTAASTTKATEATTTAPATTAPPNSYEEPTGDIELKLYVDQLSSEVQTMLSSGYTLRVVFDDGTSSQLTGSGARYTNENIRVYSNIKIKKFLLVSSTDEQEIGIADGYIPITGNINITFTMLDSGLLKKL